MTTSSAEHRRELLVIHMTREVVQSTIPSKRRDTGSILGPSQWAKKYPSRASHVSVNLTTWEGSQTHVLTRVDCVRVYRRKGITLNGRINSEGGLSTSMIHFH
jgi:hypothetical protein